MENDFISIIIPTYKEADNLEPLVGRIDSVLKKAPFQYEIIFVDDNSADGSERIVERLSEVYPVRLKIRQGRRDLSQAVVDGFKLARGNIFLVMDADLSHPTEKIIELIEPVIKDESDIAIGSRFMEGGGVEHFSLFRSLNALVAKLFARPFTKAADPMSGFFCFRKNIISDFSVLNPLGFKILLEVLVKSGVKRIREVPIKFGPRFAGESKLGLKEQVKYLRHIWRLSIYKVKETIGKRKTLFVLVLLSTAVRLLGILRPLLGNFATKNIVHAMIAKNFASNPKTILYPTLDVLVNNKPSLQMTEWPFFAYFIGSLKMIFPFVNVDIAGRLFSVIFFIMSAYLFYSFCKMITDKIHAQYAVIFYLFFPLGIIYGQSFLLEASVIFFITSVFFNIYRWNEGSRSSFRAFIIWFSISMLLLMKIQLLCLGLPVLVLILMDREGMNLIKKPSFYLFSFSCLILPLMWYWHTLSVAKAYDNVFFSVIYSIKVRKFPDPLIFSPAFYLKIIKTLAKETFSPVGLVLTVLGIFIMARSRNKKNNIIYAYLASMAVYFLVLASKIYEMNYYYVPLLVPGAILAGYGILFFKTKPMRNILIAIFILSSIVIAYNPSFKTPDNEKNFVLISREIQPYIEKNAKIVVSSKGCPIALLYYIGRRGWTLGLEEGSLTDLQLKARQSLGLDTETDSLKLLEKYRAQGAGYYICDNPLYLKDTDIGLYEYLVNKFQVIHTNDYFLVKLLPPN